MMRLTKIRRFARPSRARMNVTELTRIRDLCATRPSASPKSIRRPGRLPLLGTRPIPRGAAHGHFAGRSEKLVPSAHVRLSEYAARRDIPAARIAAGCKTTLGKDTRRVKWHVLKDSHAHTHNQGRQENMISRDPRWQTFTDRLLRIGGAVVCAFPEEDMDLILKGGRTWTPRQSQILP